VQGRVVIRDSTGISKPWDDFGVRFTGIKDGLEPARLQGKGQHDGGEDSKDQPTGLAEYRPARLRSGGDITQIDEVVERHLEFAEARSKTTTTDYLNHKDTQAPSAASSSPFYSLYLRRMLSGILLSPHETFSHPVALIIAISSRNPAPIDELRKLYTSSNTGEARMPVWVNNEYLRYYVLIHDEDYDDIKKSTTLFEQMKRHFGLHCHLLRLRSAQCVPTDDDSMRLPVCQWVSAAEEIAEIVSREDIDDDEDPTPYIFESDAAATRSFVREMVTQSIIPGMERLIAMWNDQVASRRRGISGRFMSLSKRFTPFSGRSVTGPAGSGASGNYDAAQGFYRPDTPEAIMRKLADYAFMLRDFRLAQNTYDILCQDFKNDKAWKYYAGANEMAAVSALLSPSSISTKFRRETVDQCLENAYYSYTTRCLAPFNAQRTLLLGAELLQGRSSSALDDAARWLARIVDDTGVGPAGHALLTERISSCFASRKGVGILQSGARTRKAAFFATLASNAWLELDKPSQAERCLTSAKELYGVLDERKEALAFDGMLGYIEELRQAIERFRSPGQSEPSDGSEDNAAQTTIETLQQETEQVDQRTHRKSISTAAAGLSFDPLGAVPLGPSSPVLERPNESEDGFE